MSTRSSIVYTEHVHIFHECITNEICIDIKRIRLNEVYESAVLEKKELEEMFEQLKEYLEQK